MATEVIHEHAGQESSFQGVGLLAGILLAVVIIAALIYFVGLASVRNNFETPQVSIPDRVDVNVNPQK